MNYKEIETETNSVANKKEGSPVNHSNFTLKIHTRESETERNLKLKISKYGKKEQ